jgi:arylsulfatase
VAGDHAIYHDGWIASSKVVVAPWDNSGAAPTDPAGYPWELYDLRNDWTQYEDVAARHPEKLKEMVDLWWAEAEKNQVLPLDAAKFTRLAAPRPDLTAGRKVFTYSGELTGTPNGDAPNLLGASYTIKAEVDIPEGGAEGMLVTQGGRFGGYGFYLLKGVPVFTWNMLDIQRVKWSGKKALSPGKHTLEYLFTYDGLGAATLAFNSVSGLGRSGTGMLKVDGVEVQTIKMPKTIPLTLQWDENFDVGADTLTPVDDKDYQTPFRFTGKLEKLTISIDRPELSKEDIRKLQMAMHKNSASE